MMKKLLFTLLCLTCALLSTQAQTVINTSFETTGTPAYTAIDLNAQNGWTVTNLKGTGTVTTNFANAGTQSIRFNASGTALLSNYTYASGSVPGISTDLYMDIYVKPIAYTTKGFSINGDDLYGGSTKRIFLVEFTTDNKIKINGSSSAIVGSWVANTWVRISIKVDFSAEKYYVAVNGVVQPVASGSATTAFSFREAYTPTTSGTRVATTKEFHGLRFNHGGDSDVGTTDTYIDDLYVGTTAIAGITFPASSVARTITVTQPDYGNITLSPVKATYNVGETVTATLTLPTGYKNNGWSGALSGTDLTKTITVANNITIGADVIVDTANPPAEFSVTLTQPTNGVISLTPAPNATAGKYYEGTEVTATVSYEACYQFDSWTGGTLTGNENNKKITLVNNINIGATISENSATATQRVVSTVAQFKTAMTDMNPGDEVILEDGNYSIGSLTIRNSGCATKPIIIRARNQGMAIITGSTSLTFESVNYITFQGFEFRSSGISTGIKLQNSSHITITKNNFAIVETQNCNWIYIGDTFGSLDPIKSGYNLINNNSFDGKTYPGKYIIIDGTATQQSQYDVISHNVFKNNGPRAENEKESIRVGWSNISMSSGFTTIEHNLFEDCDGDPEVVSIKSSDNIVRYNTFKKCLGTLSLRHGNRTIVEGNYFFGEGKTAQFTSGGSTSTIGCGGIRVYGKDHKIYNNYFEGLTGEKWDAAITITNGDVINSNASLNSHHLPENLEVTFNTLVNNKSDIEIGFNNNNNYLKAPINCLIANNIVVNNTNPIVKSYSTTSFAGVSFANNIFYPTGTATIGETFTTAQVQNIDPQLFKPACTGVNCELSAPAKVSRLSSTSPAIDAGNGTYAYVITDAELTTRTGTKDIGAHEYSGAKTITTSALDLINVGPNASPVSYSYNYTGSLLPIKLISLEGQSLLSNIKLTWKLSSQINVKHYEIEWRTDLQNFAKIAEVQAQNFLGTILVYDYLHQSPSTGSNYYRIKVVDNDGSFEYTNAISVKKPYTVSLYPNPASSFVNINLNADVPNGSEWKLYNSMGVLQFSQKASDQKQQQLALPNLATGIYYLQLCYGNKIIFVNPLKIE